MKALSVAILAFFSPLFLIITLLSCSNEPTVYTGHSSSENDNTNSSLVGQPKVSGNEHNNDYPSQNNDNFKSQLNKIFSGTNFNYKNIEEEQAEVCKLMNYLFDRAVDKGQAFDEGSYVIEDPDRRLFNFLKNLKGIYKRISSHRVGNINGKQYGFDLPINSFKPANMRHILFFASTMADKTNVIFIKPELYGVKEPDDIFFHSIYYVISIFRRYGILDPNGNKKINKKERFDYLEKNIKAYFDEFQSLIIASQPVSVTKDELRKNIREKGFSYVYSLIKELNLENNSKFKAVIKKINDATLDNKLDNNDIRTAKEIIFKKSELV